MLEQHPSQSSLSRAPHYSNFKDSNISQQDMNVKRQALATIEPKPVCVTAHAEQAALYSCTAQNRNLQHNFSSKENIGALSVASGYVYSQPQHYLNDENY